LRAEPRIFHLIWIAELLRPDTISGTFGRLTQVERSNAEKAQSQWSQRCPAHTLISLHDQFGRVPLVGLPARAILIEIAGVYDGYNNGRLGMSVRRLAERCHLAPGTVTKALRELQDRGFIQCVTRGSFNRKVQHASEWRLTWWPCDVTDKLPEKPFMQWGKQNAVSNDTCTVPIHAHLQLPKPA